MVEVEGKILNCLVSVLIDLGSSLSYMSQNTIENCKSNKVKHKNSWLVQPPIGA